jgi:hypothetical protein
MTSMPEQIPDLGYLITVEFTEEETPERTEARQIVREIAYENGDELTPYEEEFMIIRYIDWLVNVYEKSEYEC